MVLNKVDMVPAEQRDKRVKDFVKRLKWKGPVFQVSALTREGCEPLIRAVFQHLSQIRQTEPADLDPRFPESMQESRSS
jgi:GTP-binding protein